MNLTASRVDWPDPRAVALREALDAEMSSRYAGRHDDDLHFAEKARVAFAVDPQTIAAAVLLTNDRGEPVAHAAIRRLGDRFEVKKVIVASAHRGLGAGRRTMAAVEECARGLGAGSLVLQTGDRQPEAVALYERVGYRRIPVFDPYLPITNSICFEKQLE